MKVPRFVSGSTTTTSSSDIVIELTSAQKEYLIALADMELPQALLEQISHIPVDGRTSDKWKKHAESKGTQLYLPINSKQSKNVCKMGMCTTSEMNGELNEVRNFFSEKRMNQTNLYAKQMKQVTSDLIDAQNLLTLYENGNKSIRIKWILFESPSSLVRPRDFCILEFIDQIEDKNGDRIWFRGMHSIELECVPSFRKTHGFIRGHMLNSGYVFKEIGNTEVLRMYHLNQVMLNGSIPDWLCRIVLENRISSLQNIEKAIICMRLQKTLILDQPNTSVQIVDINNNESSCFVCTRKYSLLIRRCFCQKCGQVVCGKCSKFWDLDFDDSIRKVRVCQSCLNNSNSPNRLESASPIGEDYTRYLISLVSADRSSFAEEEFNITSSPICRRIFVKKCQVSRGKVIYVL